MSDMPMYSETELLFQASGSMKLLRVWVMKITQWSEKQNRMQLDEELASFKSVVLCTKESIYDVIRYDQSNAALQSFLDKVKDLLYTIEKKEISIMQLLCETMQHQIAYIVNDLDKKRKRLYEKMG